MTTNNKLLDWGGRSDIVDRLAALQRLREQAAENHRLQMLDTLDEMIAAEVRALQRLTRMEAQPRHDPGQDPQPDPPSNPGD